MPGPWYGPDVLIVANLTALSALSDTGRSTGYTVFVQSVLDYYQLNVTSTATIVAGSTAVAATLSGTGRWLRMMTPDPQWQQQQDWYVDPVAGNDENTGATALLALKSDTERSMRWGTYTLISASKNVYWLGNVTVASFYHTLGRGVVLHVYGTKTSVVAASFTATTARASGTNCADVTSVSMTGANSVNRLITLDSGLGWAWVAKDLGADKFRLSPWMTITDAGSPIGGTPTLIADPGNVAYNVWTLSTVTGLNVDMQMQDGALGSQLVFEDLAVQRPSPDHICYLNVRGGGGISFLRCDLIPVAAGTAGGGSPRTETGCVFAIGCRTGGIIAGDYSTGGIYQASACLVAGTAISARRFGLLQLDSDTLCQAVAANIERNGWLRCGSFCVFDAPGVAVNVEPLAEIRTVSINGGSLIWGSGNGGVAMVIGAAARVIYTTKPTITGSVPATNDFSLPSGNNAWAAAPLADAGTLAEVVSG